MTTRYEKRKNLSQTEIVLAVIKSKTTITPHNPVNICCICCEHSTNIKFINCIKGGIQNIDFGKWGNCCKDKPVCVDCWKKLRKQCPFCNNHKLHPWIKGKGKKLKKTFAEAEIFRQGKLKAKMEIEKLKAYNIREDWLNAKRRQPQHETMLWAQAEATAWRRYVR